MQQGIEGIDGERGVLSSQRGKLMNRTKEIHSSDRNDCDILVVGAGPTGLTLATALKSQGLAVMIVDRLAEGANTSRAAVVHARTLEALEEIRVAKRLDSLGVKCTKFSIRDRDQTLLPLDFSHLPTRYPYTLMVSQAVTESVLLERFGELGGNVIRPCSLAGLTQDDAGVEAIFEDGRRLRAKYAVGADGMHSKVRELARIGFSGKSYGQSFLLADVRLSGGVPNDQVVLYFSPAGLVVAAPLPDGVHRIVATVDEALPVPSTADVQALLDARGPATDRARVAGVLWGSRFRVHCRIADRYRAGRVLLAGDAAHVHSPAGGQGMNLGIRDALALGKALAATLSEGDERALDRYAAGRRPAAEEVLELTDRLTRVATVSRRWSPVRNGIIRLLARSSRFRRMLSLRLAGLDSAEPGDKEVLTSS
jgi:2-polyprenyl-6-methoxyphenol hydroxylase-like FAD-dependent oxidoreductase